MTDLNLIGRTLGNFEILEELGRGGMAVVYKARQKAPNRIVAIKVLPPELTFNKEYIKRFHQEADSVAALEHPHIVPIYVVDEDQGLHFLAMKYIQGETLKDLLQREGALPIGRAIDLLAQVAQALDYAHSQHVIHRDIKPSNMMVTDQGWVYLTDFGLARGTVGNAGLTATGTVMGTPEYMSPEQAQGLATIGPPTDIYALGIVLYELLTGRFPFEADTPMAMLAARLLQSPQPPRTYRGDLPLAVEDVIMRALARRPEARYPSAQAMIDDLRAAVSQSSFSDPQQPYVGQTIRSPQLNQPQTPWPPTQASQPQTPWPPTTQASQPQTPWPPTQTSQPQTPWPQVQSPQDQWSVSQPQMVQQPQADTKKRFGLGTGVLIGIGASVLGCILLCVVLAMLGDNLDTGNTTPTSVTTRATAQTGDPTVAPITASLSEEQLKVLSEADQAVLEADFAEAEAIYTELLAELPDSPLLMSRLALLANYASRYDQTLEHTSALETKALSDPEAALAYAVRADALLYFERPAEALEAAETAYKLDPELSLSAAVLANAKQLLANYRYESAPNAEIKRLLSEAERSLSDEEPLVQGMTYHILGDVNAVYASINQDQSAKDKAAEYYEKALDVSEQPLFIIGKALLCKDALKLDEARELYQDALEIDPTYGHALIGLGWVEYDDTSLPDYQSTIEAFRKAAEANPTDGQAFLALGRAYFSEGLYDDALGAFRTAADLNPSSTSLAWLGKGFQRVGYMKDDLKEQETFYSESYQVLKQAIEANDRNAIALTVMGWTLQYQEQYAESVDYFQRSVALDNNQSEAYNGLGWSQVNLEKYSEAEAAFRSAVELDPNYPNAWYGLGKACEELGKLDDAKNAYRQALEHNPDYQDAKDALDRLK